MALHKSTQVKSKLPVPSANGAAEVIPIVGDFTVPASGFASGDVVEMGGLPDGYVPVDLVVDTEDLGATITVDAGILTGDYDAALDGAGAARDCGAQFMAAKAFGTAGIYRMDVSGGGRIAPTTTGKGRSWGFKFTTVTTPTAGAKVRGTLLVRPQSEGV